MGDKNESGAVSAKDDTPSVSVASAESASPVPSTAPTPLTPFAASGKSTPAPPRSSFHPDVPARSGIPGIAPSMSGLQPLDNIKPNRLIIGREVRLKGGEISACDCLVLEGEVDNVNLAKARSLEIVPVGVFKGKAHVDEATVGGHFDGELTVNNRLTVKDGGTISGSVRYGSIVIEPGGSISGDMKSTAGSTDS